MEIEQSWTDWHLTATGWQPGTTVVGTTDFPREPPPTCLMTVRYTERRNADLGVIIWSLDDRWQVHPDQVTPILDRYGPCPQEVFVVRVSVEAPARAWQRVPLRRAMENSPPPITWQSRPSDSGQGR